MRSRDGNLPFVFTSLALIATLSFGTEYYYIGYRFTAKNAQPFYETLSVSKAMKPCAATAITPHQLVLKRLGKEPLEPLLNREKTLFIDFAAPMEIRIKSTELFSPDAPYTLNSFTLPTQCYAVEFNNESVTITATQ